MKKKKSIKKNNLSHKSSFRFYLWTETAKARRLRATCVHQAWTKPSRDDETGAPPLDTFLKSVQIVLRRTLATNRRWRCPLPRSYLDIVLCQSKKEGYFTRSIRFTVKHIVRHSPFIYHASPHYNIHVT